LQEAEAAANAAQSSNVNITTTYDGGTFSWPCPSSTTISSEYGNRMHPVLGVYKFHNGIDIAASTGSAIVAAYKGTVVGAGYNSSMGNYVMIDHGDGLYTIYMHASALYVSTGQNVAKGDTIAAVGSTGRSTGPHLHFGVRLNGSYVNPHSYVG
jgi:murein DD-endopeptidase MepM/ murein hydrolase activator NlpD